MSAPFNAARLIAKACTALDVTRTELSERLGMTRQTIWRYENGDPMPKRVQLAIAGLLATHDQKREGSPHAANH